MESGGGRGTFFVFCKFGGQMSGQPEPMILIYNADKVPLSQYWLIYDLALHVSYRNRNCGKEKIKIYIRRQVTLWTITKHSTDKSSFLKKRKIAISHAMIKITHIFYQLLIVHKSTFHRTSSYTAVHYFLTYKKSGIFLIYGL